MFKDENINKVHKKNVPYQIKANKDEDILINIIELISKSQFITVKELSQILNLTPATTQRKLKKLQVQKRIVRVGAKKTGSWELL